MIRCPNCGHVFDFDEYRVFSADHPALSRMVITTIDGEIIHQCRMPARLVGIGIRLIRSQVTSHPLERAGARPDRS